MSPNFFLEIDKKILPERPCAVCLMIFQGAIADDDSMKHAARNIVEANSNMNFVIFGLPNPFTYQNGRYRILEAVTVQNGTDVCMTHLDALGTRKQQSPNGLTGLIPGKKHQVPGREQ